MKTVSSKEKKQRRFPWKTLTIVIVMIGLVTLIAVPPYQDYIRHTEWGKIVDTTSSLRNAISECLHNSGGDAGSCNDFSMAKLGKYGITTSPPIPDKDLSSISLMKNAAIRIVGSNTLRMCVVDFVPDINKKAVVVNWAAIAQPPGEGGDTLEQCETYAKRVEIKLLWRNK